MPSALGLRAPKAQREWARPSSNWPPKLRRTVERDRAADVALAAAGWQVVRLWEHVPVDDATAAVIAVLGPRARLE